jgi:hypothetical protein
VYRISERLGLVSLNGIFVAPRPKRHWKSPGRTLQVKDAAEPGAGETARPVRRGLGEGASYRCYSRPLSGNRQTSTWHRLQQITSPASYATIFGPDPRPRGC